MDTFKDNVENPEPWFRQAWQMFEASKVTFESFRNTNPPLCERGLHRKNGLMDATKLCLALALENAFKGAYVYKEKPDLSGKKLNSRHFHKEAHDLVDLAKGIGIDLTADDEVFLKRLSSFIKWAARYSAPLKEVVFNDFKGEHKLTFPHDFNYVETLIENLQCQSGYSQKSGWASNNS